jgi:hypothetical protein
MIPQFPHPVTKNAPFLEKPERHLLFHETPGYYRRKEAFWLRLGSFFGRHDVFQQQVEQLMSRFNLQFSVFTAFLYSARSLVRPILSLSRDFVSVSTVCSITAVGLLSIALSAMAEDCACLTPSPCDDGSDGSSWIFERSYYSHNPTTGQRVTQYAPIPKVYLRQDPTYRESGFHYTQHMLRGPGGSLDAYHMVQTWGDGDRIRPYGEWKYPYRAGATPYGPWGNAGGPWTLPFDSWQNPYGLGQLRNPPWMVYPSPYDPYGNQYSPGFNGGYPSGGYDNGGYNPGNWDDNFGDYGDQ